MRLTTGGTFLANIISFAIHIINLQLTLYIGYNLTYFDKSHVSLILEFNNSSQKY